MNYEELTKESAKKLEEVRIRKAKIQEQIKTLVEALGLDENKPLSEQIVALEKENESRKSELDKALAELESKFKELEGGSTQS